MTIWECANQVKQKFDTYNWGAVRRRNFCLIHMEWKGDTIPTVEKFSHQFFIHAMLLFSFLPQPPFLLFDYFLLRHIYINNRVCSMNIIVKGILINCLRNMQIQCPDLLILYCMAAFWKVSTWQVNNFKSYNFKYEY